MVTSHVWYLGAFSVALVALAGLSGNDFANRVPKLGQNRFRYYTTMLLFVVTNLVVFAGLAPFLSSVSVELGERIVINGGAPLTTVQVVSPLVLMVMYFGAGSNFSVLGRNVHLYDSLARLYCRLIRLPFGTLRDVEERIVNLQETSASLETIAAQLRETAQGRNWETLDVEWDNLQQEQAAIEAEQKNLNTINGMLRDDSPSRENVRSAKQQLAEHVASLEERKSLRTKQFIRELIRANVNDSAIVDQLERLIRPELERGRPSERVLWGRVVLASFMLALLAALAYEVGGTSDFELFVVRFAAIGSALFVFFAIFSHVRDAPLMLLPVLGALAGVAADWVMGLWTLARSALTSESFELPAAAWPEMDPTAGLVFGAVAGGLLLTLLVVVRKLGLPAAALIVLYALGSSVAVFIGLYAAAGDPGVPEFLIGALVGALVGLATLFVTAVYDELAELDGETQLGRLVQSVKDI